LSINVYRLGTKENKLLCSVSVCSKQTEVAVFHLQYDVHGDKAKGGHGIKILVNSHVLQQKQSDGKRKPQQFFIIRLPFAHRANGSLFVCLFFRLLTKKQTEVIRLQID
jgi:hypothetical protein